MGFLKPLLRAFFAMVLVAVTAIALSSFLNLQPTGLLSASQKTSIENPAVSENFQPIAPVTNSEDSQPASAIEAIQASNPASKTSLGGGGGGFGSGGGGSSFG